MNLPALDHDLIARAENASTGATVHELNGLLGLYRNAHRRISALKANPKLASLLPDNVKQAATAEAELRAFIGRANAARVA